MRYQEQMKNLLKSLAIGHGIGLVVSFLLGWLAMGEIEESTFIFTVCFDLFVGTAISILVFMRYKSSVTAFFNMILSFLKTAFLAVFGTCIGTPIGWVFLALFVVVFAIPVLFVLIYMIISFPLTIIYITIMFIVEKIKKSISDRAANILDKIVPVISGILSILIVVLILKA